MELFRGENLAESQGLVMLFHASHAFRVTCSNRIFASSPFGLLTSPNFIDREGLGKRCRLKPLWRIGLMSVSKNKSFPGIRAICKLSVSLPKSDWCIYTMWHLSCPLIEFPLTVHVFCVFHRFLHFSICTTWLKLASPCRPSVTTRCFLITKETLFQIS